jgi:hypothetical protein
MRLAFAALGIAAMAIICSGCGVASSEWLPARPPVVTVKMREYAFVYSPTIPRGEVVFNVENVGHDNHQLVVVPLSPDIPPILQQVRGTVRRPVNPLAGIPDILPGTSDCFEVFLQQGRYALMDLEYNSVGESDAALGMASEFQVH